MLGVTKKFLLDKISGFENRHKMLVLEQSTGDIIQAIINTHPKYSHDYEKIAKYFKGRTDRETCQNVWNFLKKNIKYVIESENKQIVRSPAAILFQGVSDCKCYSLFAGGILDALKIPFCYRFTSYKVENKDPGHVFIVAYPGTEQEIWIDPVLSRFDYKKQFVYKIDKKPKSMAIYQISGIGRTRRQKRRAARAQRMAQRKARRKGRPGVFRRLTRGIEKGLKKGLRGVLKVAAAPARNAFLLLVKINFTNLGKKLAIALDRNPTGLRNLWEGLGGRFQSLINNINQGKKKRRILGFDENPDLPLIGVAPAAAATAAAPILLKVADFLRKMGIKPEELAAVAKEGINRKAKELIAQQFEGQAEQAEEYEQQADEAFDEE
jgi:hypothetical protein